MKINGKEVDMQLVVRLHELEAMGHSKKIRKQLYNYWNDPRSNEQREKLSKKMKETEIYKLSNGAPIKKFNVKDIYTGEETIIETPKGLANFLGYKYYNYQLWPGQINLSNKEKTTIYEIYEIEGE